MNKFVDFLNNGGFTLLSTILLAVITYIGTQIRKLYEEKITDARKKATVKTCVKAVEQIYKGMSGPEKLEKAKQNIVQILNSKGIEISEIELDMFIEEVIAEFNFNDLWGNKITYSVSEVIEDDLK